MELKKISTEGRNSATMNIDEESTLGALKLINAEDQSVPKKIEESLPEIATLVDIIVEAFNNGGRLIYAGAGTSGRLGILDASECPPTYGVDSSMVIGIIAGGEEAIANAVENAEDSKEFAIEDLKNINVNEKDVVVGIAASGRTPYTIGAVEYANKIGAKTGCVTTSVNSELASVSTYPIEVPTGAEPVTGSTRMKSGTAQKLILNMLTTVSMIKIGKVYGNLMVDVQMNNKKLVHRAYSIVQAATDVELDVAREYIEKYKTPKAAIVAILTGLEGEEVYKKLEESKGFIKKAIK